MQKVCDRLRVVISDNKELVEKIREQLKQRGNHCPCKLIQNEDTLCPCKEFLEQGVGECHCGLYIKTEM